MMGGEFKKINLSESTFWYLVVALLTIISLWPIWSVRFPPMQDYPQHLSQVQILSEYSNPDYDYKDNFSADLKPVPYATFVRKPLEKLYNVLTDGLTRGIVFLGQNINNS